MHGVFQPLIPPQPNLPIALDIGNEVMIESFSPPPAPGDPDSTTPDTATAPPIESATIPPVPQMVTPITPPEMEELIRLEPVAAAPPAESAKPKPEPRPSPQRVTNSPSTSPSRSSSSPGAKGGSGASPSAGGGRRGSFPDPYYPAAARAAGLQGIVKLRIVVEENGTPSSVSVVESSGHSILDIAARDNVQRRWRWPAGPRQTLVQPFRFLLE